MQEFAEGHRFLSRYTLKRRLGRGGMSEVWLARDDEQSRDVALKLLAADRAGAHGPSLLEAEWRLLGRLAHPRIVAAYELHADADPPCFAMAYVDGGDFRRFIGQSPERFLPPLLAALDGLEHAHANGVVHRDLKASNLLLDGNGEPVIADFGIAAGRAADSAGGGGSRYGMSPQQLAGEPPAPADDIYALGALLYELMTGSPPLYPNITDERIRTEIPPPPDHGPLADLVCAMLAKTPEGRPASVREVRDQLETLAAGAADNPTLPPVMLVQEEAPVEHVTIQPASHRIAPVNLPAGAAAATREEPAWHRFAAWGGLAAMLALAAVVFLYLPTRVPEPVVVIAEAPADGDEAEAAAQAAAEEQASATRSVGLSPYQLAQLAEKRAAAERELKVLLRNQNRLEARNVTVWGNDDFEAARAVATDGDVLFREREYDQAGERYAEAADMLAALLERADPVLEEALAAAWQAFDAGQSEEATQAFEYVLAIDPDNEQATRGLARTANLDQVLGLLTEGARQESAGSLSEALATFREAAGVDPDYGPAREAVARVSSRIGDARFNELLSRGYAALERKDYAAARQAFSDAAARRPDSSAAQAGLQQVNLQARVGRIRGLREEAEGHEAAERWRDAESNYEALLAQDDTLVFARDGRERARQRAVLDEKLTEMVGKPERLATDSVYEEAVALMEQASAVDNAGPKLSDQLRSLARLIATARTPIRVTLVSDNETNVVVYKVDRLGRFDQRELTLRPGKYTAVGTRDGYRDVRREFTLVAGQVPAPVVVRCEEKI